MARLTTVAMSAGRAGGGIDLKFLLLLNEEDPEKLALRRVLESSGCGECLEEEPAVTEADHAHQHRNRQDGVRPRGEERDAARLRDLVGRRFDEAENLLLVRPDQHPDVEQ